MKNLPQKYQDKIKSGKKGKKVIIHQTYKIGKEIFIYKGTRPVQMIEGIPYMLRNKSFYDKTTETNDRFWKARGYDTFVVPKQIWVPDKSGKAGKGEFKEVKEVWISLKPMRKVKNPPMFYSDIERVKTRKRKVVKKKTIKKKRIVKIKKKVTKKKKKR